MALGKENCEGSSFLRDFGFAHSWALRWRLENSSGLLQQAEAGFGHYLRERHGSVAVPGYRSGYGCWGVTTR